MWNILTGKEKLPAIPPKLELLRSLIGGTLSILFLLKLSHFTHNPWIMAPFGASCVILYAAAQSPLAQPRNVIFGHFISAFIGLCFLKFLPISDLSIALAVGTAIVSMQILKCVHPPAGANPLVILLTADTVVYHWNFLIFPVLLGTITLVIIASVVNNLGSQQKWPLYGLALKDNQ